MYSKHNRVLDCGIVKYSKGMCDHCLMGVKWAGNRPRNRFDVKGERRGERRRRSLSGTRRFQDYIILGPPTFSKHNTNNACV